MSFVAHKTIVVNGAVTSQYIVEFPRVGDGNYSEYGRAHNLYPQMEIANMTTGIVYIAFDRAVVPPTGNGVQGTINTSLYTITGPLSAAPGDFDIAITSGNGWGALDVSVPMVSPNPLMDEARYMSIYTVVAGIVSVSFGDQLG